MLKSFWVGLSILSMAVVSGCASKAVSVKDVTVKGYIQDRQRVDQDVNGNAGYLQGNAPAPEETKKTRKVYVVEVTKNPKIDTAKPTTPAPAAQNNVMEESRQQTQKVQTQPARINVPDLKDQVKVQEPTALTESVQSGEIKEYVVEKDDTLQKISKKFYDSYSKWPQIYEANKDVIKDPNRLSPGIKIIIPPQQ